jgi:hypothetical protein
LPVLTVGPEENPVDDQPVIVPPVPLPQTPGELTPCLPAEDLVLAESIQATGGGGQHHRESMIMARTDHLLLPGTRRGRWHHDRRADRRRAFSTTVPDLSA